MRSLLNLHTVLVFLSELGRSISESTNDIYLLVPSNDKLATEIQVLLICDV